MVARDCRPRHPPDGTVCADRRPCDPLGPAWPGPAEEAVRCRAGVPGGGAGAAGRAVGAPLAAAVLRPARAPVPLPAASARLPQAAQGRRDEPPRHGPIGWIRQWIESVNDTLKGQLGLERHGGRTTASVYARVAQRLLAMAVTIWHNWATGQPVKRSLIAYDH